MGFGAVDDAQAQVRAGGGAGGRAHYGRRPAGGADVAVGDSESVETWGAVFDELNRRGVAGVEWVMSDAHRGLRAASRRVTLVSHLVATSCGKTRQIADRRDCRKVCVYL